MPARLEIAGERFGKLLVLERDGKDRWQAWLWRCLCDCGTIVTVRGPTLVGGKTSACHSCAATARSTTHGMTGTPLYLRWRAMLERTGNVHSDDYANYGGRGIGVCDRWINSFENFSADMGPTFAPELELDRRDVNGNYEPSNCRWVDRKTQQRNRRNNRILTCHGRSQSVVEWAEEIGIKANTIQTRLRRGWPIERVLLEIANR